MKKINVLVTGASGGGVGEQITKALRLSDLDLYIITTDVKKTSKGMYDGDKGYVVPYANDDEYISSIIKICDKHNIKVIFPGSEVELSVYSKNRKVFEDRGILLPINSNKVIDICTDKTKTMAFLEKNNFAFPKSVTIKKLDDINQINFSPVVIKPSIGAGGSKDVLIAQTREEVELFTKYLLNIYGEFIAQEYVGTPDSEYTVGVLSSLDGKFINSIAVRKSIETALNNRIKIRNNTQNADLGKFLVISSGISEGYVDKYPEVTKVCEEISEKIGAKAAINIQCRLYKGRVYVFEINPRYSGTTSIRAMMGYNEPEIMIKKYILNEKVERNFEYQSGYIARGLIEVPILNKVKR